MTTSLPGEPVDAKSPAKRQRTLLLVDDEPSVINSIKRLLRQDGYRILTASGGQLGLEVLACDRVDVIVSDQRMPNMTGVEFLRQVKDLYPDTVRIVLSGYTELNSITQAINEGAIYKFLTKPWDDNQFRETLREAFLHKEIADENRQLAFELKLANQRLQVLLEEKKHQLQIDEIALAVIQEILQAVPLPVLGIDNEGIIVSANEEAGRLLGKELQLMASFAEDVLPPALLASVRDEDGHWHDGTNCWRTRCRRMGSDSNAKGWLMILSPGEGK